MNAPSYKQISSLKFTQFLDLAKTQTFGEILYSILRKVEKPEECKTGWLLKVSDEEFYKAIENATKEEITEQKEPEQYES